MSERPEQWIAVIQYGDPNTNQPLKTSMGVFESKEQAENWVSEMYEGTNFIVDVLPLNDFTAIN
jgi:hypothetical protein|tara:strand:+ start:224 stop:415 length:192 start_codon:yes stop_codon:yes gene_type:complete